MDPLEDLEKYLFMEMKRERKAENRKLAEILEPDREPISPLEWVFVLVCLLTILFFPV